MPEISDKDGSSKTIQRGSAVGEMQARHEQMADGRRYVIYYTFGEQVRERPPNDEEGGPENV